MLPNLFVIGARKAGTTSLHRYLGAHPEVFMSAVKEPHYFSRSWTPEGERPDETWVANTIVTRQAYKQLYEAVDGEKVVGEASTGYLRSADAAEQIRRAVPDARLIAILRDPSDRARSEHAMYVANGFEPLTSFEDAVDEELAGCSWRGYVKYGHYHEGLSTYVQLFEAHQLKVFLYEEFRDEAQRVMYDIFEWLEVDPAFTPDVTERFNVSAVPRSATAQHLLDGPSPLRSAVKALLPLSARESIKQRARRLNRARPPDLSPVVRRRLIEIYAEGIDTLEALIDRDLSAWRRV